MPHGQTKTKVICFRMSDEDYDNVEAVSRMLGFASVSLFARSATLRYNSPEPVNTTLDQELNRLFRRIEALTTMLERLSARIAPALDPTSDEPKNPS